MHRILLATLLIGLAAAANAAPRPRPVRVQAVSFVAAAEPLVYSGTVQARHLVDLGFRVGGKVVDRPVEIGDRVRAGQVLARLDRSDLTLSMGNAANAVEAASADDAQARADLARYVALGRGSPSYLPSEYDRRLAIRRSDDAKLAEAVQQLRLGRNQLDYATLRADADGVITRLPVEVGQVVTAGQAVVGLARAGDTEIWVDVPENRLQAIRTAAIDVTPWSQPDRHLAGRVREIGALADAATRTFTVKVALTPRDADGLSLGMTATITFSAGDAKMALLPATALTDKDGAPAVWVLDGTGHARLQPVGVTRLDGDGRVAIGNGLTQGEQVITAGADLIDPDMRLTAWSGPAR